MSKADTDKVFFSHQWANLFTVHESIVLTQIDYWLKKNKGVPHAQKEGHTWTYGSYEDWQKTFDYWHKDSVRRIFKGLEKKGVLISECFNKSWSDRKKWYRIDYDLIERLEKDLACHSKSLLYNETNESSACQVNESSESWKTEDGKEVSRDTWEHLQAMVHIKTKWRKRYGG